MLAETKPRGAACIAGSMAADLYNLEIVKDQVEDLGSNRTRFLLLAKDDEDREGNKCSVVFTTEHKAGTLFGVLRIFAEAGISLTRIESIPNEPGDYSYFIDFDGSNKNPVVMDALDKVEKQTTGLKILGFYNEKKVDG